MGREVLTDGMLGHLLEAALRRDGEIRLRHDWQAEQAGTTSADAAKRAHVIDRLFDDAVERF